MDRSLNESRQRPWKTSPKVTPITSATNTQNPAPGPMISTPAYTDKNSTPPDLLFSVDDSVSSVDARQAELKDLEVFCNMVQQLSDTEYDKVEGRRKNDTTGDASTDCARCNASIVIIHELDKEVTKLEEQLQETAPSGVFIAKLKDVEANAKRSLERKNLHSPLWRAQSCITSCTPQKEARSASKPHRATDRVAESKTVTAKSDTAEENNVKKTNGKTDNIIIIIIITYFQSVVCISTRTVHLLSVCRVHINPYGSLTFSLSCAYKFALFIYYQSVVSI